MKLWNKQTGIKLILSLILPLISPYRWIIEPGTLCTPSIPPICNHQYGFVSLFRIFNEGGGIVTLWYYLAYIMAWFIVLLFVFAIYNKLKRPVKII